MTTSVDTPSAGQVERITWLADDLALLLVRLTGHPGDAGPGLFADSDGTRLELEVDWLPDAASDGDGAPLRLATVRLPRHVSAYGLGPLYVGSREEPLVLEPESLEIVRCTPLEFAGTCRSALDEEISARAQAFLAATPARHARELDDALAESLHTLRDGLRSPLPTTEFEPGPLSARLEEVTRLGERSFWVRGWVHHADPEGTSFTAVSPEGERRPLPPGAVTFHLRPAYAKTLEDDETVSTRGFQGLVDLEYPSRHPNGWLLEFAMSDGKRIEHATHHPVDEQTERPLEYVRKQLGKPEFDEAVIQHQVLRYFELRRGAAGDASITEVVDLGDVPSAPDISVVVAVRKLDRLQHLLGELARDPDLAEAEVLFVAPDPVGRLLEITDELQELYGVPFRVVKLSGATRRQRALNLGASVARGRLLVLMSSDVLPAGPGWLERLRNFHDSSEEIAVVAPKLLREDDSLAHAGVEYTRRRNTHGWQRNLPLVGLARTLGAANQPRHVDAATDACLMIAAADFQAVDGFSELYVGEADEGADLCLRLAAQDRQTWYCPDGELYLLDRPDKPRKSSPARERFNDWLFLRRCGSALPQDGQRLRAAAPPKVGVSIPPIPSHGSRRPGNPIEEIELTLEDVSDSPLLEAKLSIASSENHPQPVLYDGTYAFGLAGWAIPREQGPVTIQVSGGARDLRQMNAKLPSPKLAEKFPDVPGADAAGFQFVIGTLSLPMEFELRIDAQTKDGTVTPLGRVRGRRRPLRSGYRPQVQPLLVTMTGRSGSNWMITLLGSHPEVVTYQPFVYEPQLASYWTAVMRYLGDPASYMQAMQPELYEWDWWTGHGRKSALPMRKPTAEMAQWFGSDHVEVLAGFCQNRLDAFYVQAAQKEGREVPRYFAEKCVPGTARLLGELYPDGREIILVRDFRDRICSILDYNEKRQHQLWGRDKASNDEEWFVHLRNEAQDLLENWQQRQTQAHLVRYEDLILRPEETMTGIAEYLGVDSRPGTISETLNRAHETSPQAQERHRTASSVQESVGRWKRELTPEQQSLCAESFDDILVAFGYEATNGFVGTGAARDDQPAASS